MKTPLLPINIISIYKNPLGDLLPLPSRMARCTPDTYVAVFNIAAALAQKGGRLILSDLFRSYDMQAQSHQDYISGRKTAFSPPPGGSFHEAGRAFDLDLNAISRFLGYCSIIGNVSYHKTAKRKRFRSMAF